MFEGMLNFSLLGMLIFFLLGMLTFIFAGMPASLIVVAFTVTVLNIEVATFLRETLSGTDV